MSDLVADLSHFAGPLKRGHGFAWGPAVTYVTESIRQCQAAKRTHRGAEDGHQRGVEPEVFPTRFLSFFFWNRIPSGWDPSRRAAARTGLASTLIGSHTSATIPEKVVFHSRRHRGGKGELGYSSKGSCRF